QELTLYRHTGEKYVTVVPDGNGRCALPQLEMEVALLDGWVRFWFRGELLPLPADLLREVQAMREQLRHAERLVEQEKQARLAAEARADSLAKELERMRQSQAGG